MLLILLLFVIISASLTYWWLKLLRNGSGPIIKGCIPIIGHTHKLIGNTKRLLNFIEFTARESLADGGVSRLILAMETYYVITDPEDLATVGNTCLQKHFSYNFAKPWLGEGLISSTASIWKVHRKMLNPAFTLQVLHGFLPVFNATSRNLLKTLEEKAGKGIFDTSPYFRNQAMKTLSQTALGISGQNDDALFVKYMAAADQLLEMIVMRFQNIWLQSDLIYRLIGLKKKESDLIKVVNDMSSAVIKEKRSKMNSAAGNSNITFTSGMQHKAFLDLLLEMSAENKLSDKEIREEVDSIIIAGTDTSSWLVTYICATLGTYPRIQEKVVEELRQVMGDTDRDVDKDDLPKLEYIEAVIKEALRVFPLGSVTLRTVDTEVKLKNCYLRPGDHIIMSLCGVHRHPVWGPDADQFRPERWLEGKTYPNAFGGFGVGKRSCIGKTYAMMSMKTLLAHVLRKYTFYSGDVTKLKLKMDFIAKPISGHYVAIAERRKSGL